jgi:hypothetical protein
LHLVGFLQPKNKDVTTRGCNMPTAWTVMTIVIISLRSDSNNVLKDYFNKDHLGVLEGTATTRQLLQPVRTGCQEAGRTDTVLLFKTWQGNCVQPTLLYQSSLALYASAAHTPCPQASAQETVDARPTKKQPKDCPNSFPGSQTSRNKQAAMKPDNDEFICTVADTEVHFIRVYLWPDHAANHSPILFKHESFAKMNLVSQNR